MKAQHEQTFQKTALMGENSGTVLTIPAKLLNYYETLALQYCSITLARLLIYRRESEKEINRYR